jgi:hypothetical protein
VADVAPLYFSLRHVQPFADMSTEPLQDEEGVQVVHADGQIIGLRLAEAELVLRLPAIIERLGLEPDRVWARLRADADWIGGRRQATWGGGGA